MIHRNPVFVLAVIFACCQATAVTFGNVDEDGDGRISKREFYEAVENVEIHESWDTDNDGLIDEAEFNSVGIGGNWSAWDLDDDGYLTRDQFYERYWEYYDTDDDGYWGDAEWAAADAPWWDLFPKL